MSTVTLFEDGVTFADEVADELRKLLQAEPSLSGWQITGDPGNHVQLARGRTRAGIDVEIVVYCPKRLPHELGFVQIERDFSGERVSDVRICVLAVPTISVELRDRCHALGWGWLDLDGNCEIRVPDVLDIQTKRNPER